MAHLTLVGLSEDGTRLLLVSDTGVEFTLTSTPGSGPPCAASTHDSASWR